MKELRNAGYHVTGIGKFHFRNGEDDNGFSEEILPMHLAEDEGELLGLLRSQNAEPIRQGLWDLYTKRCGPGDETTYQAYDKRVTERSIEWLRAHAQDEKPWALCVHYVSAHAPYTVPQDLLDLYPLDRIAIPSTYSFDKRPQHPAAQHLRKILGRQDDLDERLVRLLTASYYAAITYLDREIGQVLDTVDVADLRDATRIVYTADHGFSSGNHFILGLFNLYEHSVGVPLLASGAGIPHGAQASQLASHVDIFPTILDFFGVPCQQELPGTSLMSAMRGQEDLERPVYAEYHALGSRTASYMVRRRNLKLIHHVGMPSQLFDLASDPAEETDLIESGSSTAAWRRLSARQPAGTSERSAGKHGLDRHGAVRHPSDVRLEFHVRSDGTPGDRHHPHAGARYDDLPGTSGRSHRGQGGMPARQGDPGDVDVVVTLTTATRPIYNEPGRPDRLVIGVGAFKPEMAEIGERTLAGSVVFADDPAGARHEAGDLLRAGIDWRYVGSLAAALRPVARPRAPVVFKSVGTGAWYLAAGRVALCATGPAARGAPPPPQDS